MGKKGKDDEELHVLSVVLPRKLFRDFNRARGEMPKSRFGRIAIEEKVNRTLKQRARAKESKAGSSPEPEPQSAVETPSAVGG